VPTTRITDANHGRKQRRTAGKSEAVTDEDAKRWAGGPVEPPGALAPERQERPDSERGFRPPARPRDARMQDGVSRLPLGANAGHG